MTQTRRTRVPAPGITVHSTLPLFPPFPLPGGLCPTSTKHPPIPQLPEPPTELSPPPCSTLQAPYAEPARALSRNGSAPGHSPCLVHLWPPAPRSTLSTHQAPSESLLSANIKELERVILPPQVIKKPDERKKTTVFKHWASGSLEE